MAMASPAQSLVAFTTSAFIVIRLDARPETLLEPTTNVLAAMDVMLHGARIAQVSAYHLFSKGVEI